MASGIASMNRSRSRYVARSRRRLSRRARASTAGRMPPMLRTIRLNAATARAVEAHADERDVDEHARVRLGAEPAPAARRQVVRPVEDEAEQRREDDDGRALAGAADVEEELEGEDEEGEAHPDHQLLPETVEPATVPDGGVGLGLRQPRPGRAYLSVRAAHHRDSEQAGCHVFSQGKSGG